MLWNKSTTRILLLQGPGGVGKTLTAVALALKDVLDGKAESIVLSRPLVEAGQSMGFLPGDVNEKVGPFLVPIQKVLQKISFGVPENIFESCPLNHMRGMTFSRQVALLDESQNCKYSELRLFLSRMGKGSKLILNGDSEQLDIKPTQTGYDCDFDALIDDIHDVKGVEVVEFKDHENLRDPMLVELLDRMRGH